LQRFIKAAEDVKTLKTSPNEDELLELYSLYKQGSIGDVNTPRPGGLLDFKGKAKWDAWNRKKGISQENAKEAYIAKAQLLIETYGTK
ncbi:Acyl-CoA-binding protein-like protein, partial [Zootermopsis nevadensis]